MRIVLRSLLGCFVACQSLLGQPGSQLEKQLEKLSNVRGAFWYPRHKITRRRGPWYVWDALVGNGALS